MIKENQKYLNAIQILLDLIIVLASFSLAYYFRFYILKDGVISLSYAQSILPVTYILPIYLVVYSTLGLYDSRRIRPLFKEASILITGNAISLLFLILILFLFKIMDFSRYTLVLFGIINITLTLVYRMFIRLLLRRYRQKGYNLKHCLIIGTSHTTATLIEKIKKHGYWGYNIVGIVCTGSSKSSVFGGYKVLGNLSDIDSIFETEYLDIVIVATDETDAMHLGSILKKCEKAGIKTHIIPYYYKYVPAIPYIDDLDGIPIIDVRHVPLDNMFKSFSKRLFDIAFSLIAIILTSPVLVISAVLTKLTSPGPIIFKQERVGMNRKNFYMYKFRSMKMQSEEDEKDKWTVKNDPRRTWWGTFMRKTSIDELPQFFNVLKGDMSVIGPRPERPYFVEKFKEEIPRYMVKHQVRPGITGWAQVNGYRGDTSIEKRIEHDLYYIENWTFSLDIKIIFLTVFKGFINKNAY